MNEPQKDIQQEAKAALMKHLQKLQCAVVAGEDLPEDRLVVKSPAGHQHDILIRSLNLDKARSLSILKADFNFELRSTLWVLLVLYMRDMKPLCYLIPSTVFATPKDIFINHEQPEAFYHLSTWEIKIYRKAIPVLSQFALDSLQAL